MKMAVIRIYLAVLLVVIGGKASVAVAADKAPTEADYYRITPFVIPDGVVLEGGGLELLPDGKLAVSTRRGDIYFVSRPFSETGSDAQFTKFAGGLHEVLGLAYKDGWLYATQRPEVTRLRDDDGDGRADRIETVCDDWGITGDYHEYAFGSKFDKDGNQWVVLCLTGSFTSNTKYRGWGLRIAPDGKAIPTTSGIRSPGGMGLNHEGEMFYTENQGPWNGACSLKHLRPGKFVGHPDGNKWYDLPEVKEAMGTRPKDPESGSRMIVEAKKIPELEPPVCYFPYPKMGKSASGIAFDSTGKFGPFVNQLFVGDQSDSTVMRVFLEKVQGHYQGACFPFRSGIGSGSLGMLMSPSGSLFVGGTNRGWGSRGPKPYSLDRLDWTGSVPFEVHEMRAKPDGFELTFTQPVDPQTAGDVQSYKLTTYTYIYQASYGSPEVDQTEPTIESATVSADGKSVRLKIDGLQEGHVHELHLDGVMSAESLPLLHKQAYYTLNYIPESQDRQSPKSAIKHVKLFRDRVATIGPTKSIDGKWTVKVSGNVGQLVDAKTGEPVGPPLNHAHPNREHHRQMIWAFNPDGNLLATAYSGDIRTRGDSQGCVYVWSLPDGKLLARLSNLESAHTGFVRKLAFSDDSTKVLFESDDISGK